MLLGGCIQVTPQPTPTPISTITPIPTPSPIPQGEIIFQDGFETGLEGWVLGVSPFDLRSDNPYAGADNYLTTETQTSGQHSLKIIGGRGMVDHAGSPAFAIVHRQLDYPGPSRIGLEVWFRLGPNVRYASWGLTIDDGAYCCYADLEYLNLDDRLLYLDADGPPRGELAVGIELDDGQWHKIKMVMDPYARGYVWYMLDGSPYPFVNGRCRPSSPTASRVTISMAISPLRDGCEPGTFTDPGCTIVLDSAMYIDDVIVTKNEP